MTGTTIEVKEKDNVKIEPPKVLTPKTVQYYSHHAKKLEHSQVHKAKKFIEHHCIEYNKETKCFYCKPIEGYNKRTYTIERNPEMPDNFECNCQYFQKNKSICSHILALLFYFKLKHWNKDVR